MAILDARIPSASEDVVAIINAETNNQMFGGGRPMKASINDSSKFMAHPRENGSSQIDHKIDLPITISMPMIMRSDQYRETYNEMRQAKIAGTRLIVQTKTFTYENMFIESIPHEEDPALFDTITVIMNFTQAIIATTRIETLPPAAVANQNDSDSVQRGQVSGSETSGSVLSRVFS